MNRFYWFDLAWKETEGQISDYRSWVQCSCPLCHCTPTVPQSTNPIERRDWETGLRELLASMVCASSRPSCRCRTQSGRSPWVIEVHYPSVSVQYGASLFVVWRLFVWYLSVPPRLPSLLASLLAALHCSQFVQTG